MGTAQENVAKIDYRLTQLESEVAKKTIEQEFRNKKKEIGPPSRPSG